MSDRARLDKQQELRQKELEFRNLSESYRQEVLMEGVRPEVALAVQDELLRKRQIQD